MQTTFKTQRLLVSSLTNGHAAFILDLLNTPGWLQFIGDRDVHSYSDAVAYILKINANTAINYWTVTVDGASQPAGIISLIQREYLDFPDLGFAFLPAFEGQGYAFEAAATVMEHIRLEAIHQQLYAAALPDNLRSIKLLERLGFRYEGPVKFEHREKLLYRLALAGNLDQG